MPCARTQTHFNAQFDCCHRIALFLFQAMSDGDSRQKCFWMSANYCFKWINNKNVTNEMKLTYSNRWIFILPVGFYCMNKNIINEKQYVHIWTCFHLSIVFWYQILVTFLAIVQLIDGQILPFRMQTAGEAWSNFCSSPMKFMSAFNKFVIHAESVHDWYKLYFKFSEIWIRKCLFSYCQQRSSHIWWPWKCRGFLHIIIVFKKKKKNKTGEERIPIIADAKHNNRSCEVFQESN